MDGIEYFYQAINDEYENRGMKTRIIPFVLGLKIYIGTLDANREIINKVILFEGGTRQELSAFLSMFYAALMQ